uniref:Uncharacterized protein n=1 Tax=Acrobeloides nanus TaxID=290746 RepID=A0A914DKJ4_9BILA
MDAIAANPDSIETAQELERQRSLVIAGLPESEAPLASQRVDDDMKQTIAILDNIGIEAKPLAVYRLGQPKKADGSLPLHRLLKVVMPTRGHQRQAIANSKKLREASETKNIYIRPSLTKLEREHEAKIRAAANALKKDGKNRVHVKGFGTNLKLYVADVEYDPVSHEPIALGPKNF